MAVMLSKTKLIGALTKRKEQVAKAAKRREVSYQKAVVAFHKRAVAAAEKLVEQIKATEDPRAIAEAINTFNIGHCPRKPGKQNSAAIDRALTELELLDDMTLTVESHKQYLNILSGDDDYGDDPDDDYEDDED